MENRRRLGTPTWIGAFYTTVTDYAMTLLPHLRDGLCPNGRVLSESAVDEIHAGRISTIYGGEARNASNDYGLGRWVDRTSSTPRTFNDGAFEAQAWFDHQESCGVYVVVETGSSDGTALKAQLKTVIHELIVESPPAAVPSTRIGARS